MEFTKHRVFFIFKSGADCVETVEASKGSSVEARTWGEVGVIIWAKRDPAVGVWLLDRDLADLMKWV